MTKKSQTNKTHKISSVPMSKKLGKLLKHSKKLYIADLDKTFEDKSFAIAIIFLMSLPALPIPTGGITHVFELVTMLLAIEMISGSKDIWLPKKVKKLGISNKLKQKLFPFMIKRLLFLERHSRPRGSKLYAESWFRRSMGIPIFVLSLLALLAPPFSGLDTLFAMGTVLVALSLILEDISITIIGVIVGILGLVVEVFFGGILIHFIKNLFN